MEKDRPRGSQAAHTHHPVPAVMPLAFRVFLIHSLVVLVHAPDPGSITFVPCRSNPIPQPGPIRGSGAGLRVSGTPAATSRRTGGACFITGFAWGGWKSISSPAVAAWWRL